MKFLLLMMSCFALGTSLQAQTNGGPFQVSLVPEWGVNYTEDGGLPTYRFAGPTDPKTNLGTEINFSFYKNYKREELDSYLDKIATGAVATIQKNPILTVQTGTYVKGEIKGAVVSGSSATVSWLEKGEEYTHSQTFFMLDDGEGKGLWIGFYGGPPERWAEALKMIQEMKRQEPVKAGT